MEIAIWTGAILGVAAVAALVVKILKGARRVGHFLDDWFGEPARPGVAERPGVMRRIDVLEHGHGELRREVHQIKQQMEGA